MRKKKTLPESLELLLDTMCNTFGGIMFIAISLIILSQLASQAIKSMTAEQYSQKVMEQLEQQVGKVEHAILLLKEKISAIDYVTVEVSEEKKKLIEKLASGERELLRIKAEQEQAETKNAAAAAKLKRLQELERQLQQKYAAMKEHYENRRLIYEQRKIAYEKEIRDLEKQLQKTIPKKIRFAMDRDTSLSPYFVLISGNRIFRAGKQNNWNDREVKVSVSNITSTARMTPIRGTTLSSMPENDLNDLFRSVSSRDNFIFLSTDLDSYSTLVIVKQYFRLHGYKVFLDINPDFTYSIGNSDGYKASD